MDNNTIKFIPLAAAALMIGQTRELTREMRVNGQRIYVRTKGVRMDLFQDILDRRKIKSAVWIKNVRGDSY